MASTESDLAKSMSKDKAFPHLPLFGATWFPIYWEPMITSGERLTSAIVILGKNGEVYAETTLRNDVIKTIYGDQADSIRDMLNWAVDSARASLVDTNDLAKWTPPFEGIYVGHPRKALGENFQDIFLQAIQMSASLSSILPESLAKDSDNNNKEKDRWKSLIRKSVIGERPTFSERFDIKFSIKKGARPTIIDYLGTGFSANFAKLIPTNLSRSIKDAKSQIVDLAATRDQIFASINKEKQQLMVWKPDRENDFSLTERQLSNIEEAFLELECEGDKLELRVAHYRSPSSVAQEIIRNETA